MRINLNVPYADKDEAKSLGAWWDKENRTWFIRDKDHRPFWRWVAGPPFEEPAKPLTAKQIALQKVVVRTGPEHVEDCGCNVEPWEHCIHTAVLLGD